MAEHFNGDGHTLVDTIVVPLNQIHSHNLRLRKIQESRWIRSLRTSYPSRMNLKFDSLRNLLTINVLTMTINLIYLLQYL